MAKSLGGAGKDVTLLALCQALSFSTNTLLVTTSALVGQSLAPDGALATLPQGLFLAATTLAAMPASMVMKKLGRRSGFFLGAMTSVIGALICAGAIVGEAFWVFAAGCALLGAGNSFVLYYRFAAAEVTDIAYRSKAISLVMAGGVAAAVAGPELSKLTRGLVEASPFAGTYLAASLLPMVTMVLLIFIRFGAKTIPVGEDKGGGRPLWEIVRSPVYLLAAGSAIAAYGVMVFVMTATPLAVMGHAHSFEDAAFVIEWHVLGMFVPAFFTGHLITRFGLRPVMLSGAILLLACVAINQTGTGVGNFWAALVTLGVGWNFLFVGATDLLTRTHAPDEKARAQGLNELLVFGSAAMASFAAGAVYGSFGWTAVNLTALPLIAAVTLSLLLFKRQMNLAH